MSRARGMGFAEFAFAFRMLHTLLPYTHFSFYKVISPDHATSPRVVDRNKVSSEKWCTESRAAGRGEGEGRRGRERERENAPPRSNGNRRERSTCRVRVIALSVSMILRAKLINLFRFAVSVLSRRSDAPRSSGRFLFKEDRRGESPAESNRRPRAIANLESPAVVPISLPCVRARARGRNRNRIFSLYLLLRANGGARLPSRCCRGIFLAYVTGKRSGVSNAKRIAGRGHGKRRVE